ncbi:unnamed protein product, partial [Brenthis ino]
MPPKSKEIPTKKPLPQILRPSISGASLNYVPDNALDGYQERIETGIPWTLTEEAARHHKHECFKKYIPKLQLTQALQNKINNSIMCGFFDEKSKFSLKDQWDILLPMTLWDNEKFSNEEKKIWFQSCNSLTNDMIQLIKRAVQHDDRNVLKNDFKMVNVLRVTDCKMTEMDNGLKDFLNLTVLNLCGNYIADVNSSVLPQGLQMLELQANRITSVGTFAEHLPNLIYLGLARNLLSNDSLDGLARLPRQLTVLDLSDNDICDLEPVLTALSAHPNLVALQLTGNPCSGAITAFHVEFELPLLDSTRRNFLMFRNNESLIEMLPPSEDEESSDKLNPTIVKSKITIDAATSSHEFDIYNQLRTKNSREICHLKIFESNRVQWNKIMNFQEPTIKIFCPNLTALRDTFRTVVTVRIIYTVTTIGKQSKSDKKSAQYLKQPGEQRVTLATINCALKQPDWSQQSQHFHWDDSLGTNDAIHWGDGDLSVLQYTLAAVKTPKGKPDSDPSSTKQFPPENLTCHFGFGIDTLRV